nr:RING finger protein 212B [Zonotrichia albicollis]
MDWFHCCRCFRQDGARFAITNCGHILCEGCGGSGPCPVCDTACRYLPISDQMRPEEKVFFKNPVALALKHLAHITQVWRFQTAQAQLLVDLHRDRTRRVQAELDKAREELGERRRELESLRRENEELRRMQVAPKAPLPLPWPPNCPPKPSCSFFHPQNSLPSPSSHCHPLPHHCHTPTVPPKSPHTALPRLALEKPQQHPPSLPHTFSHPPAPPAAQQSSGQPLGPTGAPPVPQHPRMAGWRSLQKFRDLQCRAPVGWDKRGLCSAAGEGRALPVGSQPTAIKDRDL